MGLRSNIFLILFFLGCTDSFGQKRCEYYAHIGMCTKKPRFKKICHNTCVCNFKKASTSRNCKSTKHGCCWDNKTTKKEASGSDCPGMNALVEFLHQIQSRNVSDICKF